MKNKILLLIFLMLLSACQAVKDGLTGRKHENSDEFLVEKKNALEIHLILIHCQYLNLKNK